MKRKGQLEIGVTMMVLLVFFVLLIIALVVFFQFTQKSIVETRQEVLDEKFSTLVNSLTGLPELKCSIRGAERECLDATKLIAFGNVLNSNRGIAEEYIENFGINGLSVEVLYPEVVNGQDCVVVPGAYPQACGTFNLFSIKDEGLKYTTPVSIYYPEDDVNKIGKLIITAEVK